MGRLPRSHSIKTFDNILMPEETEIVEKLEAEDRPRCPYLRNIGKWYYCGIDLPEEIDERPSFSSPAYYRHSDILRLKIWCMGESDNCCYKSGELKH